MKAKKKRRAGASATSTRPRRARVAERNPALGTCETAVLNGIEAEVVRVTATTYEMPSTGRLQESLIVEGLREAARRETVVRLASALGKNDLRYPSHDVGVSVRVEGEPSDSLGIDLPAALAAVGWSCAAFGELSLSGEVRPVRGALQRAEALARAGADFVLVAPENAGEAAWAEGIEVVPVHTLKEAVAFLEGKADIPPERGHDSARRATGFLLEDVRGNAEAKRTLHRLARETKPPRAILLYGPTDSGKTMLARRAISVMQPLDQWERLDVTRINSAAGLNIGAGLEMHRPFRAPHHTTSAGGLVGGGSPTPRPGEVTLAQHGVLFLDALEEFDRGAINELGRALRTGVVELTRAGRTVRFPCDDVWLICTTRADRLDGPGPELGTTLGNRLYAFCEALGIEDFIETVRPAPHELQDNPARGRKRATSTSRNPSDDGEYPNRLEAELEPEELRAFEEKTLKIRRSEIASSRSMQKHTRALEKRGAYSVHDFTNTSPAEVRLALRFLDVLREHGDYYVRSTSFVPGEHVDHRDEGMRGRLYLAHDGAGAIFDEIFFSDAWREVEEALGAHMESYSNVFTGVYEGA